MSLQEARSIVAVKEGSPCEGPYLQPHWQGGGHIEGIPVVDCSDVIIKSGASIGGHLVASTIERKRFADQLSSNFGIVTFESGVIAKSTPSWNRYCNVDNFGGTLATSPTVGGLFH